MPTESTAEQQPAEEPTLRDALAEAFEDVSDQPEDNEEQQETHLEEVDDDFEEVEEPGEVEPGEEDEEPGEPFAHLDEDLQKSVQYMPKEMRELLEQLPEELQQQYAQRYREQDTKFQKKLIGLGDDAKVGTQVVEMLADIKPQLNQAGLNEVSYLSQLVQYDFAMRQDPEKALRQIAEGYGLDLDNLPGNQGFIDPLQEKVERLERQLEQQNRNTQQQRTAGVEQQIATFANETDDQGEKLRPMFDKLIPQITAKVKSGVTDLQDAYNAVIEDLGLGTAKTATQQKRKVPIKQKKRAASGVESTPKGAEKREPRTLRDELADAFEGL